MKLELIKIWLLLSEDRTVQEQWQMLVGKTRMFHLYLATELFDPMEKLGGYSGKGGIKKKAELLKAEQKG